METNVTREQNSSWRKSFFVIWTGQAFSLLGSQLVQFALIWWLTHSTRSATVLATATLASMLPGILLGPFAGACVDRWDRRVVMMVADGVIALATLGLAVLSALGAMRVGYVFIIMMIRALGGTFHWPAMQASTSLMVPEKHLSRVAGLNQTLSGALNIAAPPLGALLISVLPLHGVLAIDVGTALLAILPLTWIRIPRPEGAVAPEEAKAKTSIWHDVLEGLRYMLGWPGLFWVGVIAVLVNLLLSPAFALVPIFVIKHLGGQALELGWLESSWGFGIVAGGLILSVWGGFHRRVMTSLTGVVGLGLGALLIGLTPRGILWPALVGSFLAGVMFPIANGPVLAIVQAKVAPHMQGRVLTLMSSAAAAASPLGLLIAGPVADLLSVNIWFVAGGIVCLLAGVVGFFVPVIARIEDYIGPSAEGERAVLAEEVKRVQVKF